MIAIKLGFFIFFGIVFFMTYKKPVALGLTGLLFVAMFLLETF